MQSPEKNIMRDRFDEAGRRIAGGMKRCGFFCLRISLAVIFIWFGALKLIGISPAEALVEQTVWWLPSGIFLPILGWWEVAIGIGFLFRPLLPAALVLLFLHMPGTMLPLFTLPEISFTDFPFGLTLEGQYIIKNLILISAAIVIGGTLYGRDSEHLKEQNTARQPGRVAGKNRGDGALSPDRVGGRGITERDPGRVAFPITGFRS